METQNWFNPESVQPLQTSLENVLLFFLILFLCIFACVMFPYFVKRVYQNKNEEKVNPLYSHFRHVYRTICLIYASFGISILVILIIAGTNLTSGLLITSISSNMLIIWGGCVAIIILIVQVHQFTISLVAISNFLSVFPSDYQKSFEKALRITRCFLYPIVLTADSYIGSTFETNGELQCWIVYLCHIWCAWYIPISKGKSISIEMYVCLSFLIDLFSTVLFYQMTYLLCYEGQNISAGERRKSTLASIFMDIFRSRMVQPENSSNNVANLNKY